MSKRFGRNQKRKLKDIIRDLTTKLQGRAVYTIKLKNVTTWSQGYFVDQPQYQRWTEEQKERANESESHLVRPFPTENAICYCPTPENAEWISNRLNKVADLEKEIEQLKTDVQNQKRETLYWAKKAGTL